MRDPRQTLLKVFHEALRAVDGDRCVRRFLNLHPIPAPVYLVAIGKAACAMARGTEAMLGSAIRDALIITKYGHAEPLPWPVFEAAHPFPDARSLEAGAALTQFIATIPRDAQVLVLLSGGTSALVESLPPGVDLAQLQQISDWLLASGLDIAQINQVRKRMSLFKGGRLAALLSPRAVTCLALSDVPGDDLRVIGSGLLVADPELEQPLAMPLPDFVRSALTAPAAPRVNDACFERVRIEIVARLDDVKRVAQITAERYGYRAQQISEFIAGEATDVGAQLAQQLVRSEPGVIYVWGGETTVRLPVRAGRGGRNQSLALAAARVLSGHHHMFFLSAGTDGSDGPTTDAGALVDGGTIARAAVHGLDAADALTRADAGTFLEASGDLIHTGPTGTNVMDLMLGLRRER